MIEHLTNNTLVDCILVKTFACGMEYTIYIIVEYLRTFLAG